MITPSVIPINLHVDTIFFWFTPAVCRLPQKEISEISKFTQAIYNPHINREQHNTMNFLKFLNQTRKIATSH
jgi:hypothetical protein